MLRMMLGQSPVRRETQSKALAATDAPLHELRAHVWKQNPNDFSRQVMQILENKLGKAPLEEALAAPVKSDKRKMTGFCLIK
ncbi:MAG: hypothetical protein AAGE96_25245 [Cyanobacteria bacterium P01_G01_bin.19]